MDRAEALRHIGLIDLVHQVLAKAGIAHWLGGGWGVDFCLGRITRLHEDVDFAVWTEDWPRIESLLGKAGLTPKPPDLPEEARRLLGGPTDLEFWMLTRDRNGGIVVGGRWSGWPFPEGAFDAPIAVLEGVSCPVLSPEALLDSKAEYAKQPHGSPPRARDVKDILLLREYIEARAQGRRD
jgi:hypothetical protein